MVTEVPYGEVTQMALKEFEDLEERNDELMVYDRPGDADLYLHRSGGLLSTSERIMKTTRKPGKAWFGIVVEDQDYLEDAQSVAESLNQEFDIEVVLERDCPRK